MVYRGHLQTDDPRDAPKLVRMTPLRSSGRGEVAAKWRPNTIKQETSKLTSLGPPKLRNINEIRESVGKPLTASILGDKSDKFQIPKKIEKKNISSYRPPVNSMLANLRDLERLRSKPPEKFQYEIGKFHNVESTPRMLTTKIIPSLEMKHLKSLDATAPQTPPRRHRQPQLVQISPAKPSEEVKKTRDLLSDKPDILEGLLRESDRQLKQLQQDFDGGIAKYCDSESESESNDRRKGQYTEIIPRIE